MSLCTCICPNDCEEAGECLQAMNVVTTSTTDAPKARCPECRDDDVALVVVPNVKKPKEPTFYCECGKCGHQWDAQ